MRSFALTIAGAFLLATGSHAAPIAPAGFSRVDALSSFELVQEKKSESLKQRVKRAWRELTGYKFNVACPAFPIPLVLNRTTCTETGKSRADARAKCQARHPFCQVADAR